MFHRIAFMIMKTKRILIAFILVMTATWHTFGTRTTLNANAVEAPPIIILPYNPDIPGIPREQVFCPFTAYLRNNCVVLECNASLGTASIKLISTAGDNYTTVIDTDDAVSLIPISGNTGSYILYMTISSGALFVGSFDI